MDLTIRKAKEDDLVAIAQVMTEGMRYKLKHDDFAWSTEPYTKDDVYEPVIKGLAYVAEADEQIIGAFQLASTDELMWGMQPSNALYIHQLAINDSYRGKDLGKQIINWACEEVKQQGKQYLRLDFPADNEGLKKYYGNMSFQEVGSKTFSRPDKDYTSVLCQKEIK